MSQRNTQENQTPACDFQMRDQRGGIEEGKNRKTQLDICIRGTKASIITFQHTNQQKNHYYLCIYNVPLRALTKIIQITLLLPIESILSSTNCRKKLSTSKFVPDQEVWLLVYCFNDHKT